MTNRPDIQNRDDVKLLVNSFYEKIKASKIAYVFTEVAQLDWDLHLPIMYDFWSSLLLGEASYKDNAMIKHIVLSRKTPFDHTMFIVWLDAFNNTVDEHFDGPISRDAKIKAQQIAQLMEYKIEQDKML